MTALIAFLGPAWPFIAGLVVAVGGGLFGFIKSKSADTKVAQAGQQVAEARADSATSKTQTAQVLTSEADANATAALAGAQSVKERQNVENTVDALPAGSAAQQLRDQWSTGSAPGAAPAGNPDPDAHR